MTISAVCCPECDRLFSIQGRGKCRCGAYLVHHMHRGSFAVTRPDRTWIFDQEWVPFQEYRERFR